MNISQKVAPNPVLLDSHCTSQGVGKTYSDSQKALDQAGCLPQGSPWHTVDALDI